MKGASEFRSLARDALRGKWVIAVIVGLLVVLLGGVTAGGPEFKINFAGYQTSASIMLGEHSLFTIGGGHSHHHGIGTVLFGSVRGTILAGLVMAVLYFILGSVVEVGYARFNLDLVDGLPAAIEPLFSYFSHWKTTAAARLLQFLYVLLWSLLLFIPGVIASYSYAMTGYVLAEHPELTASEAIRRSKELMSGNRWRLFCLDLSFIGWILLCMLTFGIGNLWLRPYQQAARAAFYREVSGTERYAILS